MTLQDIENMNKEYLLATDVAPVLGCDPSDLRAQSQLDPSKLGFPVVVIGTRVKIPKDGFVFYMRYGRPVPVGQNKPYYSREA